MTVLPRTVVITGSRSGIGRATAELLASGGYHVVGVDLRDADVVADLSTAEGCEAMARGVHDLTAGRVDAVFANAGVAPNVEPSTIFAVNYFGAIRTVQALRPLLSRSPTSRALVTASSGASYPCDTTAVEALERGEPNPDAGTNAYATSKHAIARWVRHASPDWARDGILLNAIAPGGVDTPLLRNGINERDLAAVVAAVPLGRLARPDEIAHAAAFLHSSVNSFIAGQVLYINGAVEAAMRPNRV